MPDHAPGGVLARAAGEIVTRFLIDRGYRRIAFIGGGDPGSRAALRAIANSLGIAVPGKSPLPGSATWRSRASLFPRRPWWIAIIVAEAIGNAPEGHATSGQAFPLRSDYRIKDARSIQIFTQFTNFQM